jgi:hypothetical protein
MASAKANGLQAAFTSGHATSQHCRAAICLPGLVMAHELLDSYLLAFRYLALEGGNSARESLSQYPAVLIRERIESRGILGPYLEVKLLVSAGSVAANLANGCGRLR